MRIISGKHRGRILIPPQDSDVRPTGAKVREAVFGKIQFEICGASFLDLFAGSGAMGIEALSRGAEKVVFNDNSNKSNRIIHSNLLKVNEQSKVMKSDYQVALKSLANERFDYIFVDAPYALDCIDNILQICYDNDTLSVNGYIIYEHNSDKDLNFSSNHYIIVDNKCYATTMITYFKRVD